MLVSFHDLARLELTEAAEYYDSESAGLGQAFITEVERSADEIVQYPEAGLVMPGSIHRRLIRRFPYALLYRVKPTEIRILAVMNLKRRPAYWVGRS
jgi:plasmid stabilization system protein ParE